MSMSSLLTNLSSLEYFVSFFNSEKTEQALLSFVEIKKNSDFVDRL